MVNKNTFRKGFFLSMLIGNRERFPWSIFSFLLLISFLPYLGATFDRSFFLPGEAVGMFEHYGNICFTIVYCSQLKNPIIFNYKAPCVR